MNLLQTDTLKEKDDVEFALKRLQEQEFAMAF